jgi:hypothetical protein
MDDLAVGSGLAPQFAGRELHRIEGVGNFSTAVRRDVVDVVGAVEADDGATPALHIARRAGVSWWVPCAYADLVADRLAGSGVRGQVLGQHAAVGPGEREASAGPALELVLGGEAGIDGHRRRAGQPVLVVRGRQIVLRCHALDRMAEPSAGDSLRSDETQHHPEGAPLPILGEQRFARLVLDWAEPVQAAQIVNAVHVANPTAVVTAGGSNFSSPRPVSRVHTNRRGGDMRAHIRSSVISGIATIGIGALAIAPMAAPPEPHAPRIVSRDVQLTAAGPPLGAIPRAFIHNQIQYCSLICPFAVQLATTVPLAAAQTPITFLGALASTRSPLMAIGIATASVTGRANAALTPLINNDVFLVVPKAFHALDVAIVEGFNVAGAVLTPGEFIPAVQTGRTNILNALNQPVGPPTTPTGATNILQVVSVAAVDVTAAVAFQAGELLLAGVVQIADASAQELAQSGDPAAALAAGVSETRHVVATASAPVVSAVTTAVANIRNSLHDPFPAAVKTDQPKKPDFPTTTRSAHPAVSESRSRKRDSDVATSTSPSTHALANVEHPTKNEHRDRARDDHRDNHRRAKAS